MDALVLLAIVAVVVFIVLPIVLLSRITSVSNDMQELRREILALRRQLQEGGQPAAAAPDAEKLSPALLPEARVETGDAEDNAEAKPSPAEAIPPFEIIDAPQPLVEEQQEDDAPDAVPVFANEAEPEKPPVEQEVESFPERPARWRSAPWSENAAEFKAAFANKAGDESETPPPAVSLEKKIAPPPAPPQPRELPEVVRHVLDFIKGGNIWAAGGVVMLLLGFGYLLSYMAETGLFGVEMRISSAAIAGLAMVGAGVKLRSIRASFAMILQGGGVSVLYLTVFGAAKLTTLLPTLAALTLMTLLAAAAVALAVMQSAQLLALFAFLGGYAAPILLSDKSGNYIALFSYYSLLGVSVLGLSRFRNWPWLNLSAAAASFVVMGAWINMSYDPAFDYVPLQWFLIGFTAIFVAITLSSAQKGGFSFRSAPDALLALSVPFAFVMFQISLLYDPDLLYHQADALKRALSWSAAGTGAAFIALSLILFRFLPGARKLAAFYLGFGFISANLILPLETQQQTTAALWAIEGAFFFFFACLQRSAPFKLVGLLLQFCGLFFFANQLLEGYSSLLLTAALMGLSAIASGLMQKASESHFIGKEPPIGALEQSLRQARLSNLLIIAGALLWFAGLSFDSASFASQPLSSFLLGVSLSSLLLFGIYKYADVRILRDIGSLPALAAAFAIIQPIFMAWSNGLRPFDDLLSVNFLSGPGLWAWLAFAFSQSLILLGDSDSARRRHANLAGAFALVLLAMLTSSGRAWTQSFELAQSWVRLSGVFPSLAFIGLMRLLAPRLTSHFHIKILAGAAPLAVMAVLGWWCAVTLFDPGSPAPLPLYIPILNPLELLQGLCIAAFALWQVALRPYPFIRWRLGTEKLLLILDALIFVWLHSILFRSAYFFADLPLGMINSYPPFQTAITILWALFGVTHMVMGHKKGVRLIWLIGASLMGAVAIKLFLIDIADKGAVVRIVSFLATGAVFLFVGWRAPLPPAAKQAEQKEKQQ